MDNYIKIKKTQLTLYNNIPLYYLSQKKEGVLFKEPGVPLNKKDIAEAENFDIYIKKQDKEKATKELLSSLNMDLAKKIANKGINSAKKILNKIVEEALTGSLEHAEESLPETIEIMFDGFSKQTFLLEKISKISTQSTLLVEHSVNVFVLSLLYCCINDVPVNSTKKITLSALLHDIGFIDMEKGIVENQDKFSEKEFKIYKAHTKNGYNRIKNESNFDPIVATVALEHHEKLDGSGYPNKRTSLSFESQLIGLIDSYEWLTYHEKAFRTAQTPFDAMKKIKQDVLAQKYDKELFKNFCLCLTK